MTRFARSAITSIFTTSLDFALLAALVELAGLGHPLATFLGTLVGSTSNFLINRSWAFRAGEGRAGAQAVRYVLVQLGSIGLHTLGVWWLADLCGVRYLVAKVIVAVAAYLAWNFPLCHFFVFRTASAGRSRRSELCSARRARCAGSPRQSRRGRAACAR